MWLCTPLNDLLSSPAKIAMLRVLTTVNVPLSGREVARRAGVSSAAASRALGELTASGLLLCRVLGRTHTYELDLAEVGLVCRLRELFRAEEDRVRRFVADVRAAVPEMVSLVLFGSEARGDAHPGSDTDILIVVPARSSACEQKVLEACLALEEQHGLALSWQLVDSADLREWVERGDPFWRNVRAEGTVLSGETLEGLERRCRDGTSSSARPASSVR